MNTWDRYNGEPVIDSNGVTVKHGDIIECPNVPFPNHAERYHRAYTNQNGEIEIRDLGHNNIGVHASWGDFFVIGNYKEHLDKLEQEDIEEMEGK